MTDDLNRWKKDEMEEAAEERRRDLERPEEKGRPDSATGAFNPVEGVPPHGAGIPDKKD